VDLVKIDVQGFEGHVIEGMTKTIRQSPRLIVLSEFWPHGLRCAGTDPADFLGRLEDAGLRLFELGSDGTLIALRDKQRLIERHQGRNYTSVVGVRGDALPQSVRIRA
jgi:hypothetical protein